MKARILAVTAALAVALTAVAVADTKTLTGKIKGDSNAKVTVKLVKNKNGVATRIKSLTIARVDTRCSYDEAGRSNAGPQVTVKFGSAKIEQVSKRNGRPVFGYQAQKRIGDATFSLSGRVPSRKGTKVTGTVSSNDAFGDVAFDGTSDRQDGRICGLLDPFTAKIKKQR